MRRLRRVILAELVTKLAVKIKDYGTGPDGRISRVYTVSVQMREGQDVNDPNDVTFKELFRTVKSKFVPMVVGRIGSDMKKAKSKGVIIKNAEGPKRVSTESREDKDDDETKDKKVKFEVNGDASDDEPEEDEEEGAKMEKRKADEDSDSSDSNSSSSSSSSDSDESESDDSNASSGDDGGRPKRREHRRRDRR